MPGQPDVVAGNWRSCCFAKQLHFLKMGHLRLTLPGSQVDIHIQYERVGADVTMKCGSMDWDAAVTWTANGTDIDESHLTGLT
ncbi:hypothetical protein DUI87_06455 [Hirundo rustica rustica]|uniref:Uncharacterized protein n=1 Tax=Hirundo rustica rustica TaxID=333673 RepID=A0A3M0KT97_HIRRU|nr:hypothetical protein DUI87_06455 [Hirundo rustica rustica]